MDKTIIPAHPEREAVEGFNAKTLRQAQGERKINFIWESSSSRSGDPAVKKLKSRAGSPLREDDERVFNLHQLAERAPNRLR
jgi:hypothetical protein